MPFGCEDSISLSRSSSVSSIFYVMSIFFTFLPVGVTLILFLLSSNDGLEAGYSVFSGFNCGFYLFLTDYSLKGSLLLYNEAEKSLFLALGYW